MKSKETKADKIYFHLRQNGGKDICSIDLDLNSNIIVYSENRRELELFVEGLLPSCNVLVLQRDELKEYLIGLGGTREKEQERLLVIKEADVFDTGSWKMFTGLLRNNHRMMILTSTVATFTELTSQQYRKYFSLCILFKAPQIIGKLVFSESGPKPSTTSLDGRGEFFLCSWSSDPERLSIDYHEEQMSHAERTEREFLDSTTGYAKEIAYKTVLLVKELRSAGFHVGCRGRMNWSAFYLKEAILGHGAQKELQDYFSTSLWINRRYPLSELELSSKAFDYIRKHWPEDVHSYYGEDGSWILSNAIILHILKDYDDFEDWCEGGNTGTKAADSLTCCSMGPNNHLDAPFAPKQRQNARSLQGFDEEIDKILCEGESCSLVFYEQLLQILLLFCDMESLALREKGMRRMVTNVLEDIRHMFLVSALTGRMTEEQQESFLSILFDSIPFLERKSNIMDRTWIRLKLKTIADK